MRFGAALMRQVKPFFQNIPHIFKRLFGRSIRKGKNFGEKKVSDTIV
jgi:hypothetical protein